jgi:hypothetical protein
MAFGGPADAPSEQVATTSAAAKVDHTCEYRIRDLATSSVTLFPSRAHVVRNIKNVTLKVSWICFVLDSLCVCYHQTRLTFADYFAARNQPGDHHRPDANFG